MQADIRKLLARMNPYCRHALEAAAGQCVSQSHYEVSVAHFLLHLLQDGKADCALLLRSAEIDPASWQKGLQRELESLKTGNPGKPVFSNALLEWFEQAWMLASLNLGLAEIRSGALLLALIDRPLRYGAQHLPGLDRFSADALLSDFDELAAASVETGRTLGSPGQTPGGAGEQASGAESALEQFTINFTAQARDGKIDPVFGREQEIRQMIDILARRRKNNPIVVGEPGVGKTAVVEGLALKIVQNDVPEVLQGVELYSLDLGLLQAGASMKGQFEERLTAVIEAVKAASKPIILFIDEAHTLIGAGGTAGGSDAANLLKPALARGELRTIAATTWSEYKKYFEKDAALARRFQPVKIDEPDIESAVLIMRGLRDHYEQAHQVYIRDDAVVASVELAARYITGRQLPDKSVDLLDTACARVKVCLYAKPVRLDDLERHKETLKRERDAIIRDTETNIGHQGSERLQEIETALAGLDEQIGQLRARWQHEQKIVHELMAKRRQLRDESPQGEALQTLQREIAELNRSLADHAGDGDALIDYEVTAELVGKVVSDWTGIPVGDMLRSEADMILNFKSRINRRIKGQDHAIEAISEHIKAAKAGLTDPDAPLGVFLLVGPSGVGKTECCLGVAEQLFGGEHCMTVINMSEFQEKHAVSRLVGSPPGYVGYGEGGVLTEAVRQRPYTVVLLDEVEKADLEVMNLFYQVFDKGMLSDSEGREIDFSNTVIFLTSNLATDTIMQLCAGGDRPAVEQIVEAIRPELQQHFKPALLARMSIIPFYPLMGEVLHDIIRIKLNKVGQRMRQNQGVEFIYDDDVVATIAARCTDVDSGARNIDHIVNKNLLPKISTCILSKIGQGESFSRLRLGVCEHGDFAPEFVA